MNFNRGMRRLAIAIWCFGLVLAAAVAYEDHGHKGLASLYYFAAGAILWSVVFVPVALVIRWIWLGFTGGDAPK